MNLSGQITVTTAGQAVSGPAQAGPAPFALKAHPDNTAPVWVGNAGGTVSSSSGFPLNPGETIVITLSNLSELRIDAGANGSKLCWVRLNGL